MLSPVTCIPQTILLQLIEILLSECPKLTELILYEVYKTCDSQYIIKSNIQAISQLLKLTERIIYLTE